MVLRARRLVYHQIFISHFTELFNCSTATIRLSRASQGLSFTPRWWGQRAPGVSSGTGPRFPVAV